MKKLLPKEKLVYQAKLDQKYSVRPDNGLIEDSLKVYDEKEVTLEMNEVPQVSAMIAQIQDEVKGIAEVRNCDWRLPLDFKLGNRRQIVGVLDIRDLGQKGMPQAFHIS